VKDGDRLGVETEAIKAKLPCNQQSLNQTDQTANPINHHPSYPLWFIHSAGSAISSRHYPVIITGIVRSRKTCTPALQSTAQHSTAQHNNRPRQGAKQQLHPTESFAEGSRVGQK
jgi:hypothetical protein